MSCTVGEACIPLCTYVVLNHYHWHRKMVWVGGGGGGGGGQQRHTQVQVVKPLLHSRPAFQTQSRG